MHYEMRKKFTKKIDNYQEEYQKLSNYLRNNGIDNKIAMPRLEIDVVKVSNEIKEAKKGVYFCAELSSLCFSKEKSKIRGDVYFAENNEFNRKRANEIIDLLMSYEL